MKIQALLLSLSSLLAACAAIAMPCIAYADSDMMLAPPVPVNETLNQTGAGVIIGPVVGAVSGVLGTVNEVVWGTAYETFFLIGMNFTKEDIDLNLNLTVTSVDMDFLVSRPGQGMWRSIWN